MNDGIIEGKNIVLRPMTAEDTDSIVAWRNNRRVRDNFIYREQFTPEGHAEWVRTMVDTGKVVQFIICEREGLRPVGSVYFRDIDREKGEAEYGIFIGEDDAAGKGYGSGAARLAVDYAFAQMGMRRLILRVFADNLPARRSYEKAGFRRIRRLPMVECSDGQRKDMILMEITKTLVSFVIPCYHSERTLEGVVREIDGVMAGLSGYDYEIVLVNDGPPDSTFRVIRQLCAGDDRIKGVCLSRNFGQHGALMAGFHEVSGDIVVCLDDDGQTPADEVGKLLDGIREGADVVYARYEHKHHSPFRNFGSKVNEWMTRIMLGKPKELYISSYFAARRFVVDEIIRYRNAYPYVIGLVLRTTKNITNVTVRHRDRESGTSGYTLGKLLGLWFNGFTSFSIKPLRIATAMGLFFSLAGFAYGVYTVIKRFVNPHVPMGFSSTMAAIVFMGGMMMVMLGMIGEYIGRMYLSMNNSPQYVVREVVGGEDECAGDGREKGSETEGSDESDERGEKQ